MWRQKAKDGSTQLVGGLTIAGVFNALYPVGSVIFTTDNTNPGTRYGGTTWAAFGAGRAIVGVGNNGENTYTSEQTFGVDAVTLDGATSGTNSHTHTYSSPAGYTSGISANHTHPMSILSKSLNPGTTSSDNAGAKVVQGSPAGAFNATQSGVTSTVSVDHQHIVGAVSSPGTVTPHENRQKSIALYAWKRTA